MRLKRYVDFGLLEIGQQIWLRLGQPEYSCFVRLDPLMPSDNNIVFEVLYKGQLFSSNNLSELIKRFQANGFKLLGTQNKLSEFYINKERTKTLYKLDQLITRIVCKEYNINLIKYSKDGLVLVLPDLSVDLEHLRKEIKYILGHNIVEFVLAS